MHANKIVNSEVNKLLEQVLPNVLHVYIFMLKKYFFIFFENNY